MFAVEVLPYIYCMMMRIPLTRLQIYSHIPYVAHVGASRLPALCHCVSRMPDMHAVAYLTSVLS